VFSAPDASRHFRAFLKRYRTAIAVAIIHRPSFEPTSIEVVPALVDLNRRTSLPSIGSLAGT